MSIKNFTVRRIEREIIRAAILAIVPNYKDALLFIRAGVWKPWTLAGLTRSFFGEDIVHSDKAWVKRQLDEWINDGLIGVIEGDFSKKQAVYYKTEKQRER